MKQRNFVVDLGFHLLKFFTFPLAYLLAVTAVTVHRDWIYEIVEPLVQKWEDLT